MSTRPHSMMRLRSNMLLFLVVSLVSSSPGQSTKENSEFKLAVNLYNSGLYDLAVDQFQNFINAYPRTANSIEARFYLGLTQMKLKRYEDARVTFQGFALAYTDNPKAPEAWMRVGDAYAALENDREAASAYERVKVFHPKSPLAPEALLKAAHRYRKAGLGENARKSYRTVVQDYPSSSSVSAARLGMGELHLEDERTELAEGEFIRVMESAPEPTLKARAALLLGKLQVATGRVEEAERLFNRVLTSYRGTPSVSAAGLELGLLLQQRGKNREAIEHFRKAFADSLAEPEMRQQALMATGNAYAELNDFSSALRQYERFLSTFPGSDLTPSLLLRAGEAAAGSGNLRAALEYFQRVIASQGNEADKCRATVLAAETATKVKDYTRAAGFYSSYLEHYPADGAIPQVLMRLGELYENHLRDYRRAVSHYEDVLVKFPESPLVDDALSAVARSKEAQDDIGGALTAYSELTDQYPSSEHVAEAKERSEFLRNHKAKNRDAGFEKLALLMGEMLTSGSKAQMAMKLGEIYFHDLKEYRSAAKQFGAAMDEGLDEQQAVDAQFYRARAYDLLADLEPQAATQAATHYDEFLKRFPTSTLAGDAAFYALQVRTKGKSGAEVAELVQTFLKKFPTSVHRPDVLLMLASGQEGSGKMQDAMASYAKLTKEFTNTAVAQLAWLELGKLYTRSNLADSAARALTNASSKFPRGTRTAAALWLLAEVRLQQKKLDEAIELYRRITTDHFYSSFAPRAKVALADAYLESGSYDQAIALLQSMWQEDQGSPFDVQDNARLSFKLATAYNRKGDRRKAVELYRAYLQHDRTSLTAADAFFALGVIARDQGKTASASAYFTQAAAISGSGRASSEIADLLFHTEQYGEAEKQFAQLASSAREEADRAYFQSRVILSKLRRNDLKGADPLIKDFAKSFKKFNDLVGEVYYEKGLYYFHNQDYSNGRKTFAEVANDFDGTRFAPWAEFYLGKILEVTNKSQEALKKYESILKRFPKSDVVSRVYLSLGNIAYNSEKYQDAIVHYQRVVEAPESAGDILPYAMNNLIDTYEAVQLYDAAMKVTREYLERFPADPRIMDKRINVGILYTRLGYYDQAIVHLQDVLDEAASDLEAEIRYAIGEAYFSKGDYQQSILEFLKVPYLVTRQGKVDWTATSFYMAGQAYEKMSKFDQAVAMYKQIIDRPGIDPTFKAAAKKEIDRVKMITRKNSN